MKNNHKLLGIFGFAVKYNFSTSEYSFLALKIHQSNNSPNEWFLIHDASILKDNLSVFKHLEKQKLIQFNIDELTEEEIIEMFTILSY